MEHIPPLHDQTWGDNSNAEELVEENNFLGIHLRAKKKNKNILGDEEFHQKQTMPTQMFGGAWGGFTKRL